MTVLGAGNEKADDKETLVEKVGVATITPSRDRLLHIRRRRSVITLIMAIGFFLIFLIGTFLTVCFIKRIGPFRRHLTGVCLVGRGRFNNHHSVYESYEITDKYMLFQVPSFNHGDKHFDASRTLHLVDKQLTVIQYKGNCYLKKLGMYQMLHQGLLEDGRAPAPHHLRVPEKLETFNMRKVMPALPVNFLRENVSRMADAMCTAAPVFHLDFMSLQKHHTGRDCRRICHRCHHRNHFWQVMFNHEPLCRKCHCGPPRTHHDRDKHHHWPHHDKDRNHQHGRREPMTPEFTKFVPMKQPEELTLPTFIVNSEANIQKDSTPASSVTATSGPFLSQEKIKFFPIFEHEYAHRSRRSVVECKPVATVYEGYSPMAHGDAVPMDVIHEC